jgi:hypothetical protein
MTFAAVMEISTVKVILALAITWGVPAKHGDIPNAYVKANKEEHLDIFLSVPVGMDISEETLRSFRVQSPKNLVLRLQKSLYGLKQAGRLWSQLLHSKLIDAGFIQCITDMCVYFKRTISDVVVVGVYVNDLLVTGSTTEAVVQFFVSMESLSIKNLGHASKFLGMRIEYEKGLGYKLDQEEAINDLLRDFGLEHANTTRVQIMNDCYELQSLDEQLLEQFAKEGKPSIKNFQSLVGTLLWIARCTRPDIAFAVHKATRQTHKPRMYDWKVAKRVARYLKGTKTFKLAMKNTVKE